MVNIQNSTLYNNFKELQKLGHNLDHCSITSESDFDNKIYQQHIKNVNALLSNSIIWAFPVWKDS